jgi:hypothetical protein
MTRFWDWFASSSLWRKTGILLLGVLAILLAFAGYARMHHGHTDTLGGTAYLLLFTSAKGNVYGVESAVFYIVVQFAIAIWQSFFLMHILTYSHRIRFSKVFVVNPNYTRGRFSEDRTPLIFRIMNQGRSDLLNVKVRVTLRSQAADEDSIDHYLCGVWNGEIPILKRHMPFRIHVKTTLHEGAATIDLLEKVKTANDAFALIVHVEGLDAGINQLKSSVHEYVKEDLRLGDFLSIDSRKVSKEEARRYRNHPYQFFAKEEIERNFDHVRDYVKEETAV